MSAHGMLGTIAWTQLHNALEKDGFSPSPKSGPAVTQFIRDMIALGQNSPPAPTAVPYAPEGYSIIHDSNLASLRERAALPVQAEKGEVWYWQGDGHDLPESLVCPVVMQAATLRALLAAPPAAAAAVSVDGEAGVIEALLQLAFAAWSLADDAEDNGETLTVDRTGFDELSRSLDKLEELPDSQPGYTMEAAAKARWALRRLLATHPQPESE